MPAEEGAAEHRLVVDRFEGELAVVELEDGTLLDLPRWLLPRAVREGDVVRVATGSDEDGRSVRLEVDAAATAAARAEAEQALARLRTRDPGGDLEL